MDRLRAVMCLHMCIPVDDRYTRSNRHRYIEYKLTDVHLYAKVDLYAYKAYVYVHIISAHTCKYTYVITPTHTNLHM